MNNARKIIIIVGPTASGKSAYAVQLARKIGGEVISADSRQVYKGLDIGTGKITRHEMRGVPHHMLDVASPKRVFTAHDYARMARPILDDILSRGKTPIICGGTGFYIDILLGRISVPDVPPNKQLREKLKKKSVGDLFVTLKELDARRAKSIDRNNPVRLIRAIEIARELGSVPLSKGLRNPYMMEWIGMRVSNVDLRKKIRDRLHARMRGGMLAEVRRLHIRGLSWKRMDELGLEYRYVALYLQKKVSRDDMLSQLESAIWHYAKRQMTYWRRNNDISWCDARRF